ncbi:MAG: hypothetical protein LBV60_02550, partial [Streptomyces sp.]|nr:hypothetical protein [Streptomyces sp.]
RCVGGYPKALTRRERLGAPGDKISVALDSAGEVAPKASSDSSPWQFALLAALFTAAAAATAGASRRESTA